MNHNEFDTLAPDVKTAARTAARQWPDVLEADDAEQEIWLRLLEAGQHTVDKLIEMDRPLRISSLTEIGHQVGSKYRNDFELFSGNHRYGTRQVREMLEHDALDGIDESTEMPLWDLPETVIAQLNKTDTETVTERIDLFLGMKRLFARNEKYARTILAEYRDGQPVHSHSQELTRAVDSLTREMNNSFRRRFAEFTEGPGTRQAMSNYEAGRQSSKEYSR